MFSSLARNPRALAKIFIVAVLALVVSVLFVSPIQLPVVLYKLMLALVAGVIALGFDYLFFPYSVPSGYLSRDWRSDPDATGDDGIPDYTICDGYIPAFCAAMLRRALIVAAFIVAVSVGL